MTVSSKLDGMSATQIAQEWAKGGELSTGASSSSVTDDESVVRAENSTGDENPVSDESESTPGDQQETEPASSEAKTPDASAKETITVTDEQGRRRKVEIDYSNREATKKAHLMAAGARKWQAERDQAIQAGKAKDQKLTELQSNWDALETAYREAGEEGVIDLLSGQKGAYKSFIQKQIERESWLKKASPEEIEALEAREANARSQKEIERIRKENEKFRQEMKQERETADLRSLESRVNPVFDKYRFADKLGDANDEHMFDEMLWNSALKRLEPYEEQGIDITLELIEKQFREVAMTIRKRIGQQAEKKASKVVEQKKQEATENAQAKVKSGYKTSGTAKEAGDLINSGNLTGLLKNWGKFGSVFNK